jgi:hypothetical protein
MAKMRLKSADPLTGAMAVVLVLVGLGSLYLLVPSRDGGVCGSEVQPKDPGASFTSAE